ncbi:uncharacterized protein N7443_002695 [Penicillium atrosanguineum]|uniref:uncharacterized protein n=1 Tax=Penicillium atrosanguineum TaxID=1132637 RepID=UPI002389CFF2|nr:uncharacterized protein N7443_002695 [Penicillium atrosanguineum]KAJ5122592.1 hypothetical protein N7526_009529 [Penicillium atrosanguineum]KAJ5310234.1 hypothetical protein N7443_002695 [Penicillium atrosanguineum]
MADERPQFYENHLSPLTINTHSLAESLQELRIAVRNGAELIHGNEPIPDKWTVGGMFKHFPGVALAFLRLDYQSAVLADGREPSPDYRQHALQRIPSDFPDIALTPSRLSPAGSFSPIAAVTLRILSVVANANWQTDAKPSLSQKDITCLDDATNLALKNGPLVPHDDRNMGGDEMLYGRAGLLWVLLNVRAHEFDDETQKALSSVLNKIPELLRVIIDAGRQGSKDYIQKNGDQDAHPLMYAWMEGHYCFGAVHGATGILPLLLACKPEELEEHLPVIGKTITALSRFTISSNGHLPMALPPFGSARKSKLVQLCHGSPGILILLATALKNEALTRKYWSPEWDQAIDLATDRVWEEGILSKGGSLCHGISGNGWPWLMLHDAFQYHAQVINSARCDNLDLPHDSSLPEGHLGKKLTPDYFLSRALAFMLHSRETRPYNTAPENTDRDYRMPDDPYSLFEGLAGNVCAWAETCAVLQARLRSAEYCRGTNANSSGLTEDSIFQEATSRTLGFPLIGGNGAHGLL